MEAFSESFTAMSGWGRVNVVVAAVLLLIGFYVVLWGWGARQKHRWVLGNVRFRDCIRFTRMAGQWAPRIRAMTVQKWACLLAGGCLIWAQWPHVDSPLAMMVGALLTMTGLVQLVRQSLPGTILVLGSGEKTINLHRELMGNGGAFPIRAVSLLETGDIGIDMRIPGECFRIEAEHNWRHVAFGFTDCAAAVVMDCRTPTPLVKEECLHILEKHPHKAIFVVESQESCWPILRENASRVLIVDQVESCPRFLGFVLKHLEVCPSPEHPIREYYPPFQEQEQKDRDKPTRERIPMRPQLPFGWALVVLPEPRNPEAIEAYDKASRSEIGARRRLLFGLLLLGMSGSINRYYREQQKIALALHRRATQLEPCCARLFTAFGITLARNGCLNEALEVFKRAEALAPANAWVEVNIGNCYAAMGRREEAERYWEMADSRKRYNA